MEDKIKKLIKQVELLNKLTVKIVEFLGTLTLIEMAIKSIIQIWTKL